MCNFHLRRETKLIYRANLERVKCECKVDGVADNYGTRHEHCEPEWDEGLTTPWGWPCPWSGRPTLLPLRPIYIRRVTLFTRATLPGEVAMPQDLQITFAYPSGLLEEMGQP